METEQTDSIIYSADSAIKLWKHLSKNDSLTRLYHPDGITTVLTGMSTEDVCKAMVSLCLAGVAVMDENGFRITEKLK